MRKRKTIFFLNLYESRVKQFENRVIDPQSIMIDIALASTLVYYIQFFYSYIAHCAVHTRNSDCANLRVIPVRD